MNEIYRLQNFYEIGKKAAEFLKEEKKEIGRRAVAFSLKYVNEDFFELLVEEDIDWTHIDIFLLEEENTDKWLSSNKLKELLLSKITIPNENIFIPFDFESLKSYKECILKYFKNNEKEAFDIAYLGMDIEGNTGIFDFIPKENINIVFEEGFTFGFSADFIKRSSKIIFLIEKEDKKETFEKAVIRKGNYPINFVRNRNTIYLLDFWV